VVEVLISFFKDLTLMVMAVKEEGHLKVLKGVVPQEERETFKENLAKVILNSKTYFLSQSDKVKTLLLVGRSLPETELLELKNSPVVFPEVSLDDFPSVGEKEFYELFSVGVKVLWGEECSKLAKAIFEGEKDEN